MEVSGVVLRRIPCVSSFVADGRYSDLRSGFSGETRSVEFRSRRFRGITCDFADKGHRSYYLDPARCDGGGGGEKGKVNIMEKKKKKEKEKEMKKKAKDLKSLCKNLNMLTSIGFGLIDPEAEIQNKTISEATEILVKKIEKLKTEEKLLKKQKKEEKAKAKAMKMESESSSSSSSSSESSNSDCDKGNKVVDMMASFRNKAKPILEPLQQQSNVATLPKKLEDGETLKLMASSMVFPSMASHGHMLNTIEAVTPLKRVVEVCMGGKCKKLGGALLLDEFQKAAMNTGMEGSAVVACKCMGEV
ncbi:unnamed protein product [Cochlearia groenlandica]